MAQQVEEVMRVRMGRVTLHPELLQEDDCSFIITSTDEFYFNAGNVVHASLEKSAVDTPSFGLLKPFY